ncbi:MAG TPA: F-box protein, partial [Alphaproteobacteria bacterium]|nr:F-box protein [Alphaproteobacteria bacterium]
MKNDCCKFKKALLLSGAALILSTFSVQAMEEQREDGQGHNITNHGRGTLEVLPDEKLLDILSYLSPQELATVATVSKEMKAFSEDNSIWKGIAERQDIKIDPTSTVSFKNQVKDNSIFFIEGKDQKLTISMLQSLKQEVLTTAWGEPLGEYHFDYRNRKFQLANFSLDGETDNLELLNPSAYTIFRWVEEAKSWKAKIDVNGPCPANQNLSDDDYQAKAKIRSSNYRGNHFSIKELK